MESKSVEDRLTDIEKRMAKLEDQWGGPLYTYMKLLDLFMGDLKQVYLKVAGKEIKEGKETKEG